MAAKTIGIMSIKGGVGKTSIVVALGAAFAKQFKKKVLLVDANFSAPNLGLHLGLTDAEATLHQVLNDKISAEQAIYESEHGFHVMPGAVIYGEINPFKLRSKLKSLKKYYDIIVIDSSPSMNNEIFATMIASDELYLVTTPDHVTLAMTLKAINAAKQKKIPIAGLIMNKVYGKDFEITLKQIEDYAGCKVMAVLPHEKEIVDALSRNMPYTIYKDIDSSLEIKKLAGAIIGEDYGKSIWDSVKGFFRATPKQELNRKSLLEGDGSSAS
jgi:septum site-determining protein MinD